MNMSVSARALASNICADLSIATTAVHVGRALTGTYCRSGMNSGEKFEKERNQEISSDHRCHKGSRRCWLTMKGRMEIF